MELSFDFIHLTAAEEHSSAAAPPAKNPSPPPPPLLPLLPQLFEKNDITPVVTTTLSLGSLNPLFMPNSSPPEKPNSKTIDSLNSESSVVTQEEEDTTQVLITKKTDQECTAADSRRRSFKLFGVSLDYPPESVDVKKKRKMEDEDSSKFLPEMRKVLTESDVNESSRFLLGNKVVLINRILPELNLSVETFGKNTKHGEEIKVYDMDMKIERTLVLKRWKTNSFVFNGGWNKYFVNERNLKKGDEIELSWDQFAKRLNFSVVKWAGSSSRSIRRLNNNNFMLGNYY